MEEVTNWLQNELPTFLEDHWAKIIGSIFAAIAGSLIIWFRNRREWYSRQFYGAFNISFDVIRNGRIQTTAVLEDKVEEALSQVPHAVKLIKNAAKKTTEDNPFLILPESCRWHIMSQILAAIAETNKGTSWDASAQHTTVEEVNCYYGITYERHAGMKSGKIRVVVCPEWVFDLLEDPRLFTEYEHHSGRAKTLKLIRDDARSINPKFTRKVRIYARRSVVNFIDPTMS